MFSLAWHFELSFVQKIVVDSDDLLPEYTFDYSKAKPNRFAKAFPGNRVLVALDPDVAETFKDSAEVNRALRALIQAMPSRGTDEN